MNNRIIKFRAWDKSDKKICKVAQIHYADDGFSETVVVILAGVVWSNSGHYMRVHGESCELMQFTGLKDKNGTEIYEGDIVKTDYNGGFTGNIEYRLGEWLIMRGTADILADLHKNNWDIEVIGNIYENPELL